MASYSGLEKVALAFLTVAFVYVAKFIFSVIYTYVIGPAVNKVDFRSKGAWALVTGCTDGIGKAYAKELAARGCDIVLVSRSLDKLKATAEEIEREYKVSTKIVQADFTEGHAVYEDVAKAIADLEVGTLVNNVGVSYPYPEYFLDLPDWQNDIEKLIKANMVAVTKMTGLVMPGMVKRNKGVIINIGSASSCIPSPLLTVYAASKAYVEKFSEGLHMEYAKKGIIVQCVMPGFVCSNMSQIRRSTFFAPSAKTFVASALSLVGTTPRTTGFFPHAIFVGAIHIIQGICESFSVWLITRSMENTRRRALKKSRKE